MCDTMVAFKESPEQRSFFAKNSDREPEELQIVYVSTDPVAEFRSQPYIEPVEKYINSSLVSLQSVFNKFQHKYSAIVARPVWMWGAEMGLNEHGLAIGNEAVFSKERVAKDGLLGMDILRLALHNNKTAREALDFIVNLIQEYGQGGDGGYRSSLRYHNSFLIKDISEAYVLETSSKKWVAKKVKFLATISNAYTIRSNSDFAAATIADDINFKAKHENKLVTFFSQAEKRQKFSSTYLFDKLTDSSLDLKAIQNLLRSHMNTADKPKRGMGSICIHSGRLIRSGTTASFIVEYIGGKHIVWFTGAPHPCVSLFKPLVLTAGGKEQSQKAANIVVETKEKVETVTEGTPKRAHIAEVASAAGAVKYSNYLKELSVKMVKNYDLFLNSVKPLRDEAEAEFRKIIYNNIENKSEDELLADCERCLSLEREYMESVEKLV